jgi:diadenosine tetraphosphate (Ap4A) HIT family hydrolase
MANATMRKFGFPESLIKELDHWVILLRPAQVTLGSLVLAAKSEVTAFSGLDDDAFAELRTAIGAVEKGLTQFCAYERINYLMLMMVDPNVHFHVIPRYSSPREWQGMAFEDAGWPGPPELKLVVTPSPQHLETMRNQLQQFF